MRPGPLLRPGLVGEAPDLQAAGRLALQNRISLAAAYIKDAQAAVVRVGGEEPLAVGPEG